MGLNQNNSPVRKAKRQSTKNISVPIDKSVDIYSAEEKIFLESIERRRKEARQVYQMASDNDFNNALDHPEQEIYLLQLLDEDIRVEEMKYLTTLYELTRALYSRQGESVWPRARNALTKLLRQDQMYIERLIHERLSLTYS